MRRKILAIIIIIVGCCFVLYPIVGNIINVVRQREIQSEYDTMVQTLGDETKESIKTAAEEYNKKLADGEIEIMSTDEEVLEEDFDDGSGYSGALNVGTGAFAFITIPKINVDLPVYKGTNASTLEKGIGHLRNTSLPVGGESSHCVLTGHTGLPSSVLFSDISKLETGDVFYIRYLDEIHAYSVDQIKVVEPDDASDLVIFPGKDYVTLLTCYPYGINSHRLLVRGERMPYNGKLDENGNVTAVAAAEKAPDSTIDVPSEEEVDASIFDEFVNNTVKVSVYGTNLPFAAVIAIVTIIIAATAAAVSVIIVKAVKGRNKK